MASSEAAGAGHYWVRVIEERAVSLAFSQRVGVAHQSPQALLLKDGKVIWHDSHRGVAANALAAAVSQA